jgi:hypothetical protein
LKFLYQNISGRRVLGLRIVVTVDCFYLYLTTHLI